MVVISCYDSYPGMLLTLREIVIARPDLIPISIRFLRKVFGLLKFLGDQALSTIVKILAWHRFQLFKERGQKCFDSLPKKNGVLSALYPEPQDGGADRCPPRCCYDVPVEWCVRLNKAVVALSGCAPELLPCSQGTKGRFVD